MYKTIQNNIILISSILETTQMSINRQVDKYIAEWPHYRILTQQFSLHTLQPNATIWMNLTDSTLSKRSLTCSPGWCGSVD